MLIGMEDFLRETIEKTVLSERCYNHLVNDIGLTI